LRGCAAQRDGRDKTSDRGHQQQYRPDDRAQQPDDPAGDAEGIEQERHETDVELAAELELGSLRR
jgi:hypothetical protein